MRGTLEKVETREWAVIENNGQQIFGVLHRPVGQLNPPIALIMHGFASSKMGSNRCYVTLAENLAKSGMAAFRFDFRGSGDSEGTLSDITLEDLVSDGIAVLENLDVLEGIDTQRVALFGASLGGSIAIMSAARAQKRKIKALALWAPVASGELWYRDFLQQHPQYVNVDPNKVLSSYKGIQLHPGFKEQFARMTAYKTIEQLHPLPILHMHGEQDDSVSIAHQDAYKKTCPVDQEHIRFVRYPGEQHMLGYSSSFPEVIQESIVWFQRYL